MEMFVVLFGGIAVGAIALWLLLREKVNAEGARVGALLQPQVSMLTAALDAARADIARLEMERSAALDEQKRLLGEREALLTVKAQAEANLHAGLRRAQEQEQRVSSLIDELAQIRGERDMLAAKRAELETRIEADQAGFGEKLALLDGAKEALGNQFQVLAARILDEKTLKFTQQNQEQLNHILGPLGEKLKDFENKVQSVYDNETQQRTALKTEISRLVEANAKISVDANNLTRALKGDVRAQGAWGEMILERALEMAGLTRDREYRVQQHYQDEEGARLRPDVIIDLPEGRNMVIDSKVSLTHYERHCTALSEHDRQHELVNHVASVRNHMVGLAKKDYQKLHKLETLDFVIMFIPIESAYSVAVQADPNLTQDALAKNVLIVYPSTLLMALRTIAHVWRYEHQNRNAQEIARQAGALYDKFVGFVDDLTDVGERINKAQSAYDAAFSKLSHGRGNLLRSAERIRELGVKPAKSLPLSLLEAASELKEE